MDHFGEHLMIDGYGGDFKKLKDKELVFKCLDELPKRLGLKVLMKPQVISAPDTGGKDPGGWSGFVIISESHISMHTFPARGFLSADVYTCKNGLDIKNVLNYFKDVFSLHDIEQNFIKRGTKYPEKNIYK